MSMALDRLAHVLQGHRYDHTTEKHLQDGLATVLAGAGIVAEREHHLGPGDIVDFFLPNLGIGIEVKVGGTCAAATRQIHRYAQHAGIEALLLVSTKWAVVRGMPPTIAGKPFGSIVLLESML